MDFVLSREQLCDPLSSEGQGALVLQGWGAGNAGFGEFAAAGTTQSPVVSILRAQHRHHSSPRISPGAWKVSQHLEWGVLGSALSSGDQLN